MALSPLPIDAVLPDVLASLQAGARHVILEAPPGAGKTTRLPPALLGAPWCHKKVLVSEPRRIAARLSALRVTEESGTVLGQQTGYQVRFDDKTSNATRLIYMTEGLLLRRLLDDDALADVSAIVLDEVHERSADLDVVLALLHQAMTHNPELRVIAMSATLDADELCSYWGADVARHRSEGRSYPVDIAYDKKDDDRPLPIRVRSAVKVARALPGDILVFLPGAAEIRATKDALLELDNLQVDTLHGDMPLEEQSRVVRQTNGTGRVVLATNIAESSLTLNGVTTVIDSGLARGGFFDPWSGVSRLETHTISQARAIQRAGRAGRVAAGQALRLYTQSSFERRPPQDTPELQRADFSEVLLHLLAKQQRGGKSPREYRFLSPPNETAFAQAERLLEQLGAVHLGTLTEMGTLMSALSVAPRLARAILEGARLGAPARTCLAAALLSEREILMSARSSGPHRMVRDIEFGASDIDERVERFEQLLEGRLDRRLARDLDLDAMTAKSVENLARTLYVSLRKLLRSAVTSSSSTSAVAPRLAVAPGDWAQRFDEQLGQESTQIALGQALLAGFSDRVALRRGQGRDLVLENGTQASLSESSCVVHGSLLLAIATDAPFGKARKPLVRMACQLEPDWLMELNAERIEASDEYIYNADKDRVESISRLSWGKVTLDETRQNAQPSAESAAVLMQVAMSKGPLSYDPEARLEALSVRLALLEQYHPHLLESLDTAWATRIREWARDENQLRQAGLLFAAQSCCSLSDLSAIGLDQNLIDGLPAELAQALRRETPEEVQLRGGLRVKVHYEKERPPWIEARLQNFFSMTDTPSICAGRLALSVHLLAPNHRAVQVTSDLAGFWERHYPDLRKQLMRRYPKHLWPEDGRTASPPSPGRIR